MKRNRDELERPAEWLRQLCEEPRRYRTLLDETGSLALAAHRIALARCRTRPVAIAVPTGTELHAAAKEIQEHVPAVERVPHAVELADDCDAAGVAVIPPSRAA